MVYLLMTCLNGYFQDVLVESLAEALLKSPGGAVAVWGSSSMAMPDGQSLMNQELYRQIFGDRTVRLGEAIIRAKSASYDPDVRTTWILFGDPTTRLR